MNDPEYYTSKDWKPEVYTCGNPETCPHALHRMSVEEYKAKLLRQALTPPPA